MLGKSVRPDSANPPTGKGVCDQLPGRFSGMAAVLVSRGNPVGNFPRPVRAGWISKAAQADDHVVCDMENRKAVFPGISGGGSIQSLQELRGHFGSHKKVSQTLSYRDMEAVLVSLNSVKKCA